MDRTAGTASSRPTIADLTGDSHFATLARATWLSSSAPRVLPSVISNDLWQPLVNEGFSYNSLLLLEQLQALERYLWPGYSEDVSNQHVLLLVLLVNVKRQERLAVWSVFASRGEAFAGFFRRVLELSVDSSLATELQTHVLGFLDCAFQSLDQGLVRKECAPLVSIGIWQHLQSENVRQRHLAKSAQFLKAWRSAGKKLESADGAGKAVMSFHRSWLHTLLLDFLDKLYQGDSDRDRRNEKLRYCERFIELLCDLQAQLPTRRYVNTLLQDLNLLPAIRLAPLYDESDDAALLRDMYQLLVHYTYFPIDDHTGKELSRQDYEQAQNARISSLQQVAMRTQPEKLKILILANFGSLGERAELLSHLESLSDAELVNLCRDLDIRTQYPDRSLLVQDRAFYLECLAFDIERKQLYTDIIEHDRPILPTEQLLYDPSLLRTDDYNGSAPLAIPKMGLQYLTIGDFLWRSFTLYRSEAFYEIRKHLEDTVKRLQPSLQGTSTRFNGFSRLAIPINKPAIIDTVPARVGETVFAEVKAEIILDVSRLQPGLRREWESLKPDDVVFLLAVRPAEQRKRLTNGHGKEHEVDRAGLDIVRCAEVISVLDENGRILRHDQESRDQVEGFARPKQRRLLLRLDAAAYQQDKERASAGKPDVYDSINLLVRRRARENNFKAVLLSLRQLLLSDVPIPTWLHDVFLGYGDPASASWKRLPERLKRVDFRDTFLDWQHLKVSLPGQTIEPDSVASGLLKPPYVLESSESAVPAASQQGKKRRRDQPDGPEPAASADIVKVSTYTPPNTGPYPTDASRTNTIRFTAAQIEAITSGTQPGLTLIVGPPGTGKTDVATQIISNIYYNHPQQRTLLIAHSNQALNQLFQKIAALDIDERHLLRLGHGEEDLATETNFSKAGRVDSFLERGGHYLAEVQRLAASIGAPGAHGSSCETAQYFHEVYIRPRWKKFWEEVESADASLVESAFPFHAFFANAPRPLFPPDANPEAAREIARGCERHLARVFDELADIRPFEILRSQRDKSNYLLVKEARIIAMTSTHAAMRRHEIAGLGFHYDNVIVEEAAQITEIENYIPFVLQTPQTPSDATTTHSTNSQQLKRIVLVGDHLQNSPVIQNAAFKSYAQLDQSLFARLIRLGVPHIILDAQGRSRPSLAELYRWRYPKLTSLPFTSTALEFVRANAGLRYEFQFIEVPDYNGKGEIEPSPHYLQNLGEAEYTVALYQYMRLLGYPANKISILATYAGQRALIRDVLSHRCKGNRLFGMPAWVGTVDKYQGEQNDYVLLSLVRTKSPGYLRDLRRLTVALSRARLGLYIFGRGEVFESSLELREAFAGLRQNGDRLELVQGEMFPTIRGLDEEVQATEMEGVEHLGQYVFEMTKAKVEALKAEGGVLPALTNGNGVAGHVEDEEADGEGEGEDEQGGFVEEIDDAGTLEV